MILTLVWSRALRQHPLRWLAPAGDASIETSAATPLPAQYVNVPVAAEDLDPIVEAAVDIAVAEAVAGLTGLVVRFDIASPAGTWVIPHSFGRAPLAQVFLANGEQVGADISVDALHITVVFAVPTAGFVLAT